MQDEKSLAGLNKKSFSMFFGGGEIWFEHLDSIGSHTDLAIKKLEQDYLQFKKPSATSLIAVNLDETIVEASLITAIAEKLLRGEKRFTRVVFVGTNPFTKMKMKKALADRTFSLAFINDFEKAKEWLVTEEYK